ncbi:hypothetical protein ASE74_17060 [Pedobacter sp. Leaf216]|uniref:DNA-directed RNA polymerase subunit alpha C-terminal domain-containing protein n=1 Tax=Pedobacter sp. Leaf216 TaxID=1735684 RepID=UPI0006F94431|nr:DNA-directed RNA polymerase subunit alpha C-terminal domain-containing protein [Pedobacter sp. Leaf216]KQM76979.1 hypothetical protein ASE74_17060 [Pedobacter sp. Leaf216]
MSKLDDIGNVGEEITYEEYISALQTVKKFHYQVETQAEKIANEKLSIQVLETPVDNLYFSSRVKKVFSKLDIKLVKDIMNYGLPKLKINRNLGTKSIKEIKEVLLHHNLKL